MLDAIVWVLKNLVLGFYNLGYALANPATWLNWADREALSRFIYYGGSVELFFVCLDIFLVVTVIGLIRPQFMWACVRFLEGIGNAVGRAAAWFGLLMVLQQIMIIFMQGTFRQGDITFGFMGTNFTQTVGWWSEELKLYNAIIVCLCVAYTFVQGGHVRVDLFYAAAKFRTKKIIDMIGSLFFMIPSAIVTYMYGWYFMWRHLVLPKPSASDTLDRMMMQARARNWNVETIGFSPNGFNAYFLFKVLLVLFCIMVMLQAVAFFYRSYREYVEGEGSEGKYLDRDRLGDPDAELVHAIEEKH